MLKVVNLCKLAREARTMKIISALAPAAALVVSSAATGHHSASIYDADSVLNVQGTVTRYEWRNPHVYIYVDVEEEGGQLVEWELEGGSTPLMARSGWTASTLAPGDVVTARVNPNKDAGIRNAWLLALSKEDGSSLSRWAIVGASDVPAEDMSGVWEAMRGYQELLFTPGELTERGAAAQAAYQETMNPVKDCVAMPAPVLTILPYRNEIEILEDRVLIHNEYFNVERVVYMDGRGHPEEAEGTNQGHSIGRWDGDALVVDTVHFSDNPTGNRGGVPSGAQKHLIERFELSEDRTQLNVEFTLEDPEFMAGPATGEIVWDFVPDGEMLPFDCELENARRYTIE